MLAVFNETGASVAIEASVPFTGAEELCVVDGETKAWRGKANSRQRTAAAVTAKKKATNGRYWILNSRQR